jgi:hypothetical protein
MKCRCWGLATQKTFTGNEKMTKKDPSVSIAVIDKKMQEEFPRLLVSSTLMTKIKNNPRVLREYRESEPKLIHDK